MTVDKERLFKKLEHVGEHVVRENLENGVYGPNRRGLVEEWLEQFEVLEEPEPLQEEVEEFAESDEIEVTDSEVVVDETSEVSAPKKWYQRLFSKG